MIVRHEVRTHHSEEEIRSFIDNHLLPLPEVRLMMSSATWDGSVLHVGSAFGSGTLTIAPGALDIEMELTPFGMAVRGRIEEGLAKAARMLNAHRS